jgi:hypothetical protein
VTEAPNRLASPERISPFAVVVNDRSPPNSVRLGWRQGPERVEASGSILGTRMAGIGAKPIGDHAEGAVRFLPKANVERSAAID